MLRPGDITDVKILRTFGRVDGNNSIPVYQIDFLVRKIHNSRVLVPVEGFDAKDAMERIRQEATKLTDILDGLT